MRLLIPYRFFARSMKGGIEQSSFTILREMLPALETAIIIAEPERLDIIRKRLKDKSNVLYQPFPRNPYSILRGRFQHKAEDYYWAYFNRKQLPALIEKYQATHCLYFFTRFQSPPNIKIPLYGIIRDLWWHGMAASAALKAREDSALEEWLAAAQQLFAISEKTVSEVLKLFPEAAKKIVAIPHGTYLPKQLQGHDKQNGKTRRTMFYYPAQFKANKNHITLLKAALLLARENRDFTITLSGQESEQLVGETILTDQRMEDCRQFYQQNKNLLLKRIIVKGYCSRQEVEASYKNCSAVILPTLYEGFGLPLTEGLSRGKQVICNDLDVFQEQTKRYDCSEFVHFFPGDNATALAKLMRDFILNPAPEIPLYVIQEKLARWTWQHTAKTYIERMQS